jgi:hypothetical protein
MVLRSSDGRRKRRHWVCGCVVDMVSLGGGLVLLMAKCVFLDGRLDVRLHSQCRWLWQLIAEGALNETQDE